MKNVEYIISNILVVISHPSVVVTCQCHVTFIFFSLQPGDMLVLSDISADIATARILTIYIFLVIDISVGREAQAKPP